MRIIDKIERNMNTYHYNTEQSNYHRQGHENHLAKN